MSFQSLSGFRDFYPEDCALRERLFAVWRDCARRFGFSPYDGPPLETLDLYKKKSGDEIVKQLYHFVDKGDREVALRPEMTPTLARMAGAAHGKFKKPLKWFAIPQLFRYERAQKGRLREHFQWNCDILGEPGLGAESELLALLVQSFREVGLTAADVVVRVSDRQFWKDYLATHHIAEDRHYDFFQAIDKVGRDPDEVVRGKLGNLADDVFRIIREGGQSARLDELQSALRDCGIGDFIQIDLGIVRGLAYYTGVVFEAHDRAGQYRAIAGGGRYDDLLKNIAGTDLPALGFGMGDVVITEILKDKGLLAAEPDTRFVYVVVADESVRPAALRLVAALRAGGYRVDYPLAATKVGRQFEAAQDRGAAFALVVDPAGETAGTVGLKYLATREQRPVRVEFADGRVTGWNGL
ncbi:MAG: histidine--tRNA ligase [Candidatus Methylacidiphilales bacterium]|nr:histidine--tRNA ligase [Candidatus Methylacidiphilales bacterium]